MQRVVLVKIAGRHVHLLRLLGILIVVASILLVMSSLSYLFLRAKQIALAMSDDSVAKMKFGLESKDITADTAIGYFLEPIGWLIIWLGLMVIGAMVYKSGGVFIPIEEEIKEG